MFDNSNLLPVDLVQDLEDLDEEVDDVEVQLDGGDDVLLGGDTGHDHVGVEDYEAWNIILHTCYQ